MHRFIFEPISGSVPLNFPGVRLYLSSFRKPKLSEALKSIQIVENGSKVVPLAFERIKAGKWKDQIFLRPEGGFKPRTRYDFLLADLGANSREEKYDEVHIQTARPLKMSVVEKIPLIFDQPQKKVLKGPCSHVSVVTDLSVSMVLPESLRMFQQLFEYEVWVDGRTVEAHTSPSFTNGGPVVKVAFDCTHPVSEYLLTPGWHTVQLKAYLPGTAFQINSVTQKHAFRCSSK